MSVEDRLDRLERRVAALESLIRDLVPLAGSRRAGPTAVQPPVEAPPVRVIPPDAAATSPLTAPSTPHRTPSPGASPRIGSEQWLGQRGLLAVGVIALILATGYLLKLSFERGWISPFMRCFGGAVAGALVGALGWRLYAKAFRTYGAALIGCGAAIIYLSVWAAARLYDLLPPTSGIAGLALVSLSLASLAYTLSVQALGATAVLGAFFAPIVLGRSSANANVLLLYLACMGACLGWVAANRRWRLTMFLVALSYFVLASLAARPAEPLALLAYGLAGGSAGLYVGLRERWWETRFLSFAGGWTLLGVASERIEESWLILAGGVILAVPVWWHALRSPGLWPAREAQGAPGRRWRGEDLYFLITPILLGWAVHQLAPSFFNENQGLVPLIVAVPYLLAGYLGQRPAFALVGSTAAAIAALSQWVGVEAVGCLLGMALLWASLDHWRGRTDGRWYSLIALTLALHRLLASDTLSRAPSAPAFRDAWALTLWASIAVLCSLAAGLWKRDEPPMKAHTVVTLLWIAAGALMLFGVTGELTRFFDQRPVPASSAELASGLSVSAWWLLFATGLVGLGFRRDLKSLRWAGIAVAGLAVGKVFAVDLSSLDALYRVASVAILGLVSLSIAYLYHRKGKEVRRET